MNKLIRNITIAILFVSKMTSNAQENVTTLGIQVKPVVPSKFFGTGEESSTNGEMDVVFTPRFGLNLGMVVRRGLTKNWSFETGINLMQRNYNVEFQHPDLSQKQSIRFKYIGYEIPMQIMVYVRLGGQLWMNASGGFSIDMYPSNVESSDYLYQDTTVFDFYQKTYKNSWIQTALLANYGFEYRTKDRGYFYFGASFHRPFNRIGITEATLSIDNNPSSLLYPLSGSYLTADFRYFFNEKPEKKKKPKK